ncbi:fumarylacetoacetate hydrolase family protein [Paenibacillus radicis (ex Xue et al. 2023)]|uniref:Fumarylacetoacetate hydrolase family protein n=1 Tax=Paenibacillus radicis (ex Xue et al. 2023) TaxID=2972489 RepID=A0ABT1YC90_9BACL|nr:fumarylacetoacetate hydrolase family protein [Paenibacillus radicis (ex Xue et al. 2023)]MCR8630029.1 fumarylacetoacetate hydrolase family protein [Paenibacillus radicis (ex Xue et al. 2023)]
MMIHNWIRETHKIIGVGPNFKAFREQRGIAHNEFPQLFLKSPESLSVETNIYLSKQLTEFFCEVEMAVIIGEDAQNVVEEEALSIVAGYALANDITAGAPFDKGRSKLFNQTTPISELVKKVDPQNVYLEMWVNGECIQKDHTSQLLFSPQRLISYISHMATLRKGDIILTGTPANPWKGAIGDEIELKSPELGSMKHKIHSDTGTRRLL